MNSCGGVLHGKMDAQSAECNASKAKQASAVQCGAHGTCRKHSCEELHCNDGMLCLKSTLRDVCTGKRGRLEGFYMCMIQVVIKVADFVHGPRMDVTPKVHEVFEAILSERVAADQKASALILKKRAMSAEHLCLSVHQLLFQWQYALACCPGNIHKASPDAQVSTCPLS